MMKEKLLLLNDLLENLKEEKHTTSVLKMCILIN